MSHVVRDTLRAKFPLRGGESATHRLLDGGNLSVRDMELFYEMYARAIAARERAFVVALKTTPVFRMFFDVDAHLTEAPTDRSWCIRLCKYIHSTMLELIDTSATNELHAVICEASSKQVRKHGMDCTKVGLHVHYPDVHVTISMAHRIRHAVVQKLENNMPHFRHGGWAEDIDSVVYATNGLRMPYSLKCARCNKCNSDTRAECATCEGKGRVEENRPYIPTMRLDISYAVINLPEAASYEDILGNVRELCIRSTRDTPSHTFLAMPPCWFEDPDVNIDDDVFGTIVGPGKPTRKRKALHEGINDVECKLVDKQPLCIDDHNSLAKWFGTQVRRGKLPKEYRSARILAAFSSCLNGRRSHVFGRLDSQYCMNIGREHSTNLVYIQLNILESTACMKCYCRCDTTEGRRTRDKEQKAVRCSEYRSTPIQFDPMELRFVWNAVSRASSSDSLPGLNKGGMKMLC